jgi:ATP-dependent protease HslVU (ClpYQ) ATPase subunit
MATKSERKLGRPSIFTPELATELCVRLSEGRSLRSVCRDADMPAVSSVFLWLRRDQEFSEQYARAKEEAADAIFDELLEIADDPDGDVQRDRLRVDTRKWMLAKMKPRKYSDRHIIQTETKPDLVATLEDAMEQAQRQRAEMVKKLG